ncbi:MAG: hypothetical protein HY682_03445 [Chloroflexi bacterium]|nr:hypothetical protein [Chloroflexota bacterium]
MPLPDGRLTSADRATLRLVLDRLIPPSGDLPGAGGMSHAEKIEQAAQRTPGFRSALVAVLGAISLDPLSHVTGGFGALKPEQQDEAIRTIEVSMADQFYSLLRLVYAIYYSDPRVHPRIGWVSRPPQPEGFELPAFDESVLEKIRQRKAFWRRV